LHRFLLAQGITNYVVDSSSIEVKRRRRRAKSDGLDVRKLVSMLIRYEHGEGDVWRVVNVPSVKAEDDRHLHRDLETLKQERASTTTRIKSLLSIQGVRLKSLSKVPEQLDELRLWDGSEIPSGLLRRLLRVWAHHEFLTQQIAELEGERREVGGLAGLTPTPYQSGESDMVQGKLRPTTSTSSCTAAVAMSSAV